MLMTGYNGRIAFPIMVDKIPGQPDEHSPLSETVSYLRGAYASLGLLQAAILDLQVPYHIGGHTPMPLVASGSGVWISDNDHSRMVATVTPIKSEEDALYLVLKAMSMSAQQEDAARLLGFNRSLFTLLISIIPHDIEDQERLDERIREAAGRISDKRVWMNGPYAPPYCLASLPNMIEIAWRHTAEEPTMPAKEVDAIYQRFYGNGAERPYSAKLSAEEQLQIAGLPAEIARHSARLERDKLTSIIADLINYMRMLMRNADD